MPAGSGAVGSGRIASQRGRRPRAPKEVAVAEVAVASPAEVYEALRQAHALADADAAAALYAPDAEYYEPGNQVHRGRDEIRNFLAAYFANRGPVEVTVKREVT